ncbi:MAG: hypothetical protein FWD53_06855, partial [Phycisphaerales bacterium]|nr:hypothetical protein [Phycisphaerales bacterium]
MELQIQHLIPEMILLATACVVTLLGLSSKDSLRKLTQILAALALLAGFIITLSPCHPATLSPPS